MDDRQTALTDSLLIWVSFFGLSSENAPFPDRSVESGVAYLFVGAESEAEKDVKR